MITINYKPGERELASFTRIWLPLFAAALGAMFWWRTGSSATAFWIWGIGAVVTALALASPQIARLVFVGLIAVSYPIGIAVSYLVLGAMFYLVFTPLGVLMRAAGRDPLALRARSRTSHWLPCEQDDRPERAFRQF